MLILLLARLFRCYFRCFPLNTGKFPVLSLISKAGIFNGLTAVAIFDKNIIIDANLADWIQKQIYFFGRYEIEKSQTIFWNNYLKPGMIVFDVGANIGYYSLMTAKRIGSNGRVYAFEPVTLTFRELTKNIQLNRFSNILPQKIALSNIQGLAEIFTANQSNTGTSGFSEQSNFSGIKETVDTIEGDKFIYSNNISRLDVIKIDVEGAELKVLGGLKDALKRFRPLVLIEINRKLLQKFDASPEQVYLCLHNEGYKPYRIDSKGNLIPVNSSTKGNLIAFMRI